MKKRIKLTDKELAIGMWVYICLYIESYDVSSDDCTAIGLLKRQWMVQHHKASYTFNPDFYWIHDCWLCSKHFENNCLACPLGKCAGGSLYDGVSKYYQSKAKQANALVCAKYILNIIAETKEAKYEDN